MLEWIKISEINQIYEFVFPNLEPTKISALDAAHYTIEKIKENHPPPYTLYLSGGVDSQAMLWAWHSSGSKFDTFSAVYNDILNDYDLEELRAFSIKFNININYHNFDLLNFLEQEHETFARKYLSGSPQITTHIKLASLTKEGTVLFSGNFMNRSGSGLTENHAALFRYGRIENRSIIPWFFLETKELAYGFQQYRFKNWKEKFATEYDYKCYLYSVGGFPIIPQKQKYTGFEKVKDYIDNNPPRSPDKTHFFNRTTKQSSKRLFDVLYRNKYELEYKKYYIIK